MKDKRHILFRSACDVLGIDCELLCGDVEISGTDDVKFAVELNRPSLIKISESDGIIKIKQFGKPLFHRPTLKISVPAFCVPDITLKLKQGSLTISGGIYGDLHVNGEKANVALLHSSYVNADISCKTLCLNCSDISVKNSFDVYAVEGEVLHESCFCKKLDIKYKSGDLGINELKCPDSVFSVERGSLNVILKGASDEYSLNLFSKHGTCNRESVYGGIYAMKAYTEYGNIVVDFTEKFKEASNYGNDNVAEDSGVARRA